MKTIIANKFKSVLNILLKRGLEDIRENSKQAPANLKEENNKIGYSPKTGGMDRILEGKNVLVTGAGRNIGRSIALEMAAQGANIFFTEINQELCADLKEKLNGLHVLSRGFISDVSKVEDTDLLIKELTRQRIHIDILVNNVGIQFEKKSENEFDPEEWYKTYDINVFGPVYLTRLISGKMREKGIRGSIIFITSIHQWTIRKIQSYSSSKAALGMIIKELAIELGPHGIRVNGIAPGWVKLDEKGLTIEDKNYPLHRSSIDPIYVGRAAVFLASDYFSRFTTGIILKIDAGLTLHNHLSFFDTI